MKLLILIETSNFKSLVLLVSLFLGFNLSYSTGQRDPLKEANKYFERSDFHSALIYLNQIDKIQSSGPLLFKKAICQYETNQIDQSKSNFRRSFELGFTNDEIDYYLGLIARDKGDFTLAAQHFKRFLASLPNDSKQRSDLRRLVRQCGKAIQISYQTPIAIVENPSPLINTIYDDFGMIESPSRANHFYFTSNRPNSSLGRGKEDNNIYHIQLEEGEWFALEEMSESINSRAQDILSGFTIDGTGMYLYKGTSHRGQIFLNEKDRSNDGPASMKLGFKLDDFNADMFYFDPNTIIFSSDELSGFGGYDLYVLRSENGKWLAPENLGGHINSSFDEVSPYITHDGGVLYFSSNRPESLGGYDIFRSEYLYEQHRWEVAVNLGIPINSPGNERYFRLSYNGTSASFSSDRKTAYGGYDVLIAKFKDAQKGQELFVDDLPFTEYRELGGAWDDNLEITNQMENDSLGSVTYESEEAENSPVNQPELYSYSPFLLEEEGGVLSEKNVQELDRLSDYLLKYTNVNIELEGHSNSGGILEYNLFSSLRHAQKAGEYLKKKGIDNKRIVVRGVGDNYPIVKSSSIEGDEVLAGKMNPRLEIGFYLNGYDRIKAERLEPNFSDLLRDSRYDIYKTLVHEAVSYRIQIAVVNQMYRGVALDVYNDALIEQETDTGLYVYSIGLYNNYAQALQTKRNLERDGLTDARVIVYVNGVKIQESDIVYFVNEYPDLKNYMDYGN